MKPKALFSLIIAATALLSARAQVPGNFALSFSGTNDSVSASFVGDLNAYPFTVSAWINTTQTNGFAGIVNKYVAGSQNGWNLYLLAGNIRAFYFVNGTRYVWDGGDGLNGGKVNDGVWHNVAFTVDSSGGHLYVDGVLKASLGWTSTPGACTTSQELTMGDYPGGDFYKGLMDEVQIWNVSQPLSFFQTNRLRGLIGRESGILDYYQMNDGVGSAQVSDSATTDGTAYGFFNGNPLWVTGLYFQPAIQTLAASGITSASATLNSVENPENTNTTTWFEWGTTTSYGAATAMQSIGNGPFNTNYSLVLSGLTNNTTYHYRAWASNTLGLSVGTDQSFFTTSTNMITARANHTASLLPSGKVLVAGGVDQNNTTLSSAELFDPVSGTFGPANPMSTARSQHTATFLPNGKLLVAGGEGDFPAVFTSAELYDPVSGTWSSTGSMANARAGHTANLLLNGKVLVSGGVANSPAVFATELYDPSTGNWSTTGSIAHPRQNHTSTLLLNGKVLLVGGLDTNANSLASCELYDPATGIWSATGSLHTPRYYGIATLLPNGQVLVTGGSDRTNFLFSAELYDPVAGTWSTTVSMLNFRFGPTANLLPSGKVFVTGDGVGNPSIYIPNPTNASWAEVPGPDPPSKATSTLLPSGNVLITGGSFGIPTASASVYIPPDTGSWSTNSGFFSSPREFPSATLLSNGKVLLAGGDDGFLYPQAAFLFNPATGTWSSGGLMADSGREMHTATLLPNGKVLIAGGNEGGSEFNDSVLYDAAGNTWSQTGSMSTGRYIHTATLLQNGKVLVAGGYSFNNNVYLTNATLYDPAGGTWSDTAPLKTARGSHTATLMTDGRVLVAGGSPNPSLFATNTVEFYDPSSGTWTATGSMAASRAGHTATLLPNGKVLVAGGQGSTGSALASAELYNPATGTWTNTGSMISARANHVAILLPNGNVLVAEGSGKTSEVYNPVTGLWTATGPLNSARTTSGAAILPNGEVLLAGGFASGVLSNAEIYDLGLGYSNTWQPRITLANSPLALGGSLVVTGAQFRGIAEGSDGTTQDSPGDYPLVQLRSIENARMTFLSLTNWSSNSLSTASVTNFPLGYALATVFANGIQSTGSVVSVYVPAAGPFVIAGAKGPTNGQFQIAFSNTVPGATFSVMTASNITSPLNTWSNLGAAVESPLGSGQFQFIDRQASNRPQSFYRVSSP